MRKLIYYIALTLDGYIGHEDGSFDGFAWDDEVVQDFFDSYEWFDTVLMGRKTYEVGLKEGKTSPYPMLRQIVFSRSMEESPDEAVELVSQNAVEFVRNLRKENGKDIWLCGGANLAGQFLENDLIDEMFVKLNPVVFGSGIPLFSGTATQAALELFEKKSFGCGIILLKYRLKE